jgi:hypothetical protein
VKNSRTKLRLGSPGPEPHLHPLQAPELSQMLVEERHHEHGTSRFGRQWAFFYFMAVNAAAIVLYRKHIRRHKVDGVEGGRAFFWPFRSS